MSAPGASFLEPTYSVSQLCGEIKEVLTEGFPVQWVAGEVQRVHRSRNGHLYFELVEKGERNAIVGKLDAVIWRSAFQRIGRVLASAGQSLAEGQQVRCRVGVDFYGPGGRLQVIVREIDPAFTLGQLELQRQETLRALAAADLLERNGALELSAVPLDLALITSEGSAAYHDFLSTLTESGYGFRVVLLHSAVQGAGAEAELASALDAAAGLRVDAVALIRGGGARSDLAVFDTLGVSTAVARCGVPVLTGLGHQIDQAIADRVAHTALKTPTKVAELLVERVAQSEFEIERLWGEIRRGVEEPLRRGHVALERAERGVRLASRRFGEIDRRLGELRRRLGQAALFRLAHGSGHCSSLSDRLARAGNGLLQRRRSLPEEKGRRLVSAARGRLRAALATVDGVARLCTELGPQRTLERGFSITRDARGVVIRRPEQVAGGQSITTETAGGTLASRVEGA